MDFLAKPFSSVMSYFKPQKRPNPSSDKLINLKRRKTHTRSKSAPSYELNQTAKLTHKPPNAKLLHNIQEPKELYELLVPASKKDSPDFIRNRIEVLEGTLNLALGALNGSGYNKKAKKTTNKFLDTLHLSDDNELGETEVSMHVDNFERSESPILCDSLQKE